MAASYVCPLFILNFDPLIVSENLIMIVHEFFSFTSFDNVLSPKKIVTDLYFTP